MKQQLKPLALLAALFLLAPALVGSAQDQAAPSPSGTFATTITAEELPQDMPSGMRRALAGNWEVIFVKGDRFQLLLNDKPMVEGRFKAAKDELVLTDEKGVISCATAPGEETGKYRWVLEGDKLTLAPTADKCEGRKLILTIHPWAKKE